MSAESVLYTALSANAGVVALVEDRVFPGKIPQGKTLPAIVTRRADTAFVMTIHNSTPCGSFVEMDIIAVAKTDQAAENIGTAIITALAAAGITPLGRRSDIDETTEESLSIISCQVLE